MLLAAPLVLLAAAHQIPAELPREYGFSAELAAKFDAWVKETLDWTNEKGKYAVIVDKSKYSLYLAINGKVVAAMPIELGFEPVADKRMEGDGATPEGKYKVAEKRDVGQTRFHRGLLLDYPNETDRSEFREWKAAGEIPADAAIGGLILIHGSGSGKRPAEGGSNWTLGCVALSNSDIDRLFRHAYKGMPVTIVRFTNADLSPKYSRKNKAPNTSSA